MKKGKPLSVISGILLVFYSLPLLIAVNMIIGRWEINASLRNICYAAYTVLLFAASVSLIAVKARISAWLISAAAVFSLGLFIPDIITYFNGAKDLTATGEAAPQYLALGPLCMILGIALFALCLWLRGKAALFTGFASAVCEIAAMNLNFKQFEYMAGHPTPLNLLPVFLAVSAVFAGIYRCVADPED